MIIKMRYEFDSGKKATLEAVGTELGIIRERVRQIEAKRLLKMKRSEHFQEVAKLFEK